MLFSIVLLGALLGCTTDKHSKVQKLPKPNILFVMTDDQGPFGIGLKNHQVHTPHLDQLAKEGLYLNNMMTPTPVCSPSRATFLTGKYGSELGITDWINNKWESLLGLEPNVGLSQAEKTWVEVLQENGYHTSLIGKWHLGDQAHHHPQKHGYTDFYGFVGGGTTPKDPTIEHNGEVSKVEGYTVDVLTKEAIRQLEIFAKQDQAFMISLHYRAPHAPWFPVKQEDMKWYEDVTIKFPESNFYEQLNKQKLSKMTKGYYANISSVDRNMGLILSKLDALGLRENTLVVFTSDHGYNMGHNGIWHKGNGHWILKEAPSWSANIPKNQRPNLYDNSLKIPTIVSWKGVLGEGEEIHESLGMQDWFATLLDITGLDASNSPSKGKSFYPVLQGDMEYKQLWDNDFFAQYSTHHQSRTHMRAYRTQQWKLIVDFLNEGRNELYDLVKDPAEHNNLYGQATYAAIQKELYNKLCMKMKDINDPIVKVKND